VELCRCAPQQLSMTLGGFSEPQVSTQGGADDALSSAARAYRCLRALSSQNRSCGGNRIVRQMFTSAVAESVKCSFLVSTSGRVVVAGC